MSHEITEQLVVCNWFPFLCLLSIFTVYIHCDKIFESPSRTLICWAVFPFTAWIAGYLTHGKSFEKVSWIMSHLYGIVLFEKIYQSNAWSTWQENNPSVFSLVKWTHTYILINPGKYCGSKIMTIPSLEAVHAVLLLTQLNWKILFWSNK